MVSHQDGLSSEVSLYQQNYVQAVPLRILKKNSLDHNDKENHLKLFLNMLNHTCVLMIHVFANYLHNSDAQPTEPEPEPLTLIFTIFFRALV